MLLLKYVFVGVAFVLFGMAAGLVGYDVWIAYQLRRLLGRSSQGPSDAPGVSNTAESGRPLGAGRLIRWRLAGKLAGLAWLPLLLGTSIVVIPDGNAGVCISQISGVLPGTLYPGVHLVVPFVQHIENYDLREKTYLTTTSSSPHPSKGESLVVQAREGLAIGLGIAVRYRLDPQRLGFIHANVPQPVDEEVVAPVVSSVFRDLAAGFVVRDLFTIHREDFHARAAKAITERLAADGIVVKEVMLRDIQLPPEYARGLESMLLKEQESERLVFETDIKAKEVRIAELEGEAQKARDIKQAEAAAQVHVLQAKSESDAMQYTLPLKQKQIEQSRLEAEARKQSTIENAEAAAQSKVIDSHAEVERRNLLAQSDANTIRITAEANARRLDLEGQALKANPMLIQKIIAERLSDKLQIIMVPMDGKNFFAGDVLRSAFAGQGMQTDTDPPKGDAVPPRRPNQQH